MRQGSSVAPEAFLGCGLHSVLEAALDSLDVELEEELTRYRRQKHRMSRQVGYKQHIPAWKPSYRQMQKPAIDLPFRESLQQGEAVEHPIKPSLQADGAVRELKQDSQREQTIDSNIAPKAASIPAASIPTEADVWADEPQADLTGNTSQHQTDRRSRVSVNGMQTSVPRGGKLATVQARSQNQQAPNPQISSEDQEGSLLNSSALVAVQSDRLNNSAGFSDADESLEDYLESSEELLRSIAEETPNVQVGQETSLLDSLLSPLGIGSMLLLLLSSATLGYVIMHPSSMDFLATQEPSKPEAAPSASASPTTSSPFVPDSPNLAAEEFVDLNVNSLSTLPRPSRATPSATPLPSSAASGTSAPPGIPAFPQAVPLPESPSSGSNPNPPAPAPIPQYESAPQSSPESSYVPPEPVSVAPAPVYEPPAVNEPYNAIDPSPDVAASAPTETYYYVVTPYSGDPSLENAREAVPEAYVRNFDAGASVQLGAFSDPAKAEELIQQLESQGIPAEIYRP